MEALHGFESRDHAFERAGGGEEDVDSDDESIPSPDEAKILLCDYLVEMNWSKTLTSKGL